MEDDEMGGKWEHQSNSSLKAVCKLSVLKQKYIIISDHIVVLCLKYEQNGI